MKIAILADIHANFDAFQLVLKQIEKNDVAKILIAGDLIGYYYSPEKVIDICMKRNDIMCIKGNHELNLLKALNNKKLMSKFVKKYGSSYTLCKSNLSIKQISWIKNLPPVIETELCQKTITMAHGSLSSAEEYLYPNSSIQLLKKNLSTSKYTIFGHTHHPFIWSHKDQLIINPGSVGQPRDQSANASYFILDLTNDKVIPKRIKFPIEKILKKIDKYDSFNTYLKSVLTR